MVKHDFWNIDGFHRMVISAFSPRADYKFTFSEFQIDGMGVILKGVTGEMDPQVDAMFRWHVKGPYKSMRNTPPSTIHWPAYTSNF